MNQNVSGFAQNRPTTRLSTDRRLCGGGLLSKRASKVAKRKDAACHNRIYSPQTQNRVTSQAFLLLLDSMAGFDWRGVGEIAGPSLFGARETTTQHLLRLVNLPLGFAGVLAFVFNCRSRRQTLLLKIPVAIPARNLL